ncbi:ribosomal large subunit pseudouridine synthase D [Pontibacter ummariensis]|uniref:Ribosomal large subunit pseudouridine synthase D n=1 Tax=Pontibacter ummariensis TaxID=1610492 RepID=A0A239BBY9_9BACT|nr:RluA family pseudouridine synthase [Pontibacter ummariensis]PRY16455.1 ribosomal large subunit pseudouridine synthase D [Pontibacter ummariensis]SNS05456.1 ribosomal large subunit pseudouridine synthase D [Pontibacter ummariensis]
MLDVLFEDNHILAVNKPAGLLVHGDETGDTTLADLAKAYLKQKYNKPGNVFIGVVHRLDRPVSGVVLLAKTSKALRRLNELFRSKKTKKTYWAVVQNQPQQEQGTLVHWLVKDSAKNQTKAFAKENKSGQRSELHYRLLNKHAGKYLLEVNPITGRSHQIRVQLASMRCPILGDLKYGAAQPLPDKSIALHARQLQFEHPTLKTPVTVSALPPDTAVWAPFR